MLNNLNSSSNFSYNGLNIDFKSAMTVLGIYFLYLLAQSLIYVCLGFSVWCQSYPKWMLQSGKANGGKSYYFKYLWNTGSHGKFLENIK